MAKAKQKAKPTPKAIARAAKVALFIEKYLENGGNGTQAYKDAGFRAGTDAVAATEAWKLLKKPDVAAVLVRRNAERIEAAKCDADEVLISAARVVRFDPRKLVKKAEGEKKATRVELADLDDDTALALEVVEVDGLKVRVDRASARAQLMKHHGLFEKDNKQLPAPSLSIGRLTARLSFDEVRARATKATKRA